MILIHAQTVPPSMHDNKTNYCRSNSKRKKYLVVIQKSLALHEFVVLAEAVVEQVADAGVVGQHQPAHSVR